MPSQKQNTPKGKAIQRKGGKVTDVTKRPMMTTRSMQKEKETRGDLCDSVESLPGLSRILIQAINLCKSAKGLSFTELKRVVGAKGYDVSRHCPSIKRQLKSLASKGALLRMTHKAGSSFFVIRKHQGKGDMAQALEGFEKTLRTKNMGAERINSQPASEKAKGRTQQAKSSGLKAAEATKKVQSLNRKQKPGVKQSRQPLSPSTKTLQRPVPKAAFAIKRRNPSATETVPSTKRPCYSRSKHASSRKRRPRGTVANANMAKKLGSSISQAVSTRSRGSKKGETVSAKGLGRPNSRSALNVKASQYSRNKIQSSSKRGNKPQRKASFPPLGPNNRVPSNAKRPRRK